MKVHGAIGALVLLGGASVSSIAAADEPSAPAAPAAPSPYPNPYTYPYPYAAPPPGYAYPPLAVPAPEVPTVRRWYGWQTLILYSLSIPLGITSIASGSGGFEAVALPLASTGLLFGGPIIHWSHGKVARGFAVLGMHVGASVVGSGLGIGIFCAIGACSSSGDVGPIGIFLGIVVGGSSGLVASQFVDVAALSYDERPFDASTAGRRKGLGFTLLPDVRVTRDRTMLGIVGTF